MKKLKLENEASAEFRGLGIVSSEKDYRLCFFLNKELEIELEKSAWLFIFNPSKNKRFRIPVYSYADPEDESKLFFAKNKQEDFYVMPDMKQADYLLMEPIVQQNHLTGIKNSLIKIPAVQSCFVIPANNLIYIDAE